jgi:hypothetical protein
MRPRRFSSPSIYLALDKEVRIYRADRRTRIDLPFGRISFLLDLCKDTFCLVVYAVAAFGHLAITFYLLLPAHVACL